MLDRTVITKHLKNIFNDGELDKNQVCSKMEHTANDGKTYNTEFYNLDAIISVGYRVNSKKATEFRIWATKILNSYMTKIQKKPQAIEYLVKGINEGKKFQTLLGVTGSGKTFTMANIIEKVQNQH